MKVVFSDRAYTALLAECTEKIKTETGGLFLGAYEEDIWYVIETIDPGPKSIFEVAYFEYDQQYTQHLINKIANLYNEKLTLIGLWHRHPGSFDTFSKTDDGTNSKYARMSEYGAISALANIDPDFRLTIYHVERPCRYQKICYEIGNDLIPDKFMKMKEPQQYERMMYHMLQPEREDKGVHSTVSLKSFMKMIEPYFKDRKYNGPIKKVEQDEEESLNKIIDILLADISFMSDSAGIEVSIMQKNNIVVLLQNEIFNLEKIFFIYAKKTNQVIFQYHKTNYLYEESLFENLFRLAIEKKKVEE